MAASLNPDTHAGRVFAVLQEAPDPMTVAAIADATGLDTRAATTAAADLASIGLAARLGGERVRFWRMNHYPELPRPRWPDKLRARLIADVGPRVKLAG
jgi:hypothetical protein